MESDNFRKWVIQRRHLLRIKILVMPQYEMSFLLELYLL